MDEACVGEDCPQQVNAGKVRVLRQEDVALLALEQRGDDILCSFDRLEAQVQAVRVDGGAVTEFGTKVGDEVLPELPRLDRFREAPSNQRANRSEAARATDEFLAVGVKKVTNGSVIDAGAAMHGFGDIAMSTGRTDVAERPRAREQVEKQRGARTRAPDDEDRSGHETS